MHILLLEIVLPQDCDETGGWSIFFLLLPEFSIALDEPWNFWRYWCIQICMFKTIRQIQILGKIFFKRIFTKFSRRNDVEISY